MLLSPVEESICADLRWFYRDSEGALGLKSNYGGMLASLEGGGFHPTGSYEVDMRKLEAAERARHISIALGNTKLWARVVLAVALRYSDGDVRLIGALASTNAEYRRARSRRSLVEWLERTYLSKDTRRRQLFSNLREEARALLCSAVGDFARVTSELARERRRPTEASYG